MSQNWWPEKKSVSQKWGPENNFTIKSRDRKRILIRKLGPEKNCDLKTGDRKKYFGSQFWDTNSFLVPTLRVKFFPVPSFQITFLFRSPVLRYTFLFRSPILRHTLSLEFLENVYFCLMWRPSLSNILKDSFWWQGPFKVANKRYGTFPLFENICFWSSLAPTQLQPQLELEAKEAIKFYGKFFARLCFFL